MSETEQGICSVFFKTRWCSPKVGERSKNSTPHTKWENNFTKGCYWWYNRVCAKWQQDKMKLVNGSNRKVTFAVWAKAFWANQVCLKRYFLQKYFIGGHFKCHVIQDHLGNNINRLGLSPEVQVKKLARRNYTYQVNTIKQPFKIIQNTVCNWKTKTSTDLVKNNSVTCSYKLQDQEGTVGFNFMLLLERRLDSVVYRLGLATTHRPSSSIR